MELRDVEIFLTLAEELHFGRTAARLHLSQARVSQSVAKAERRIGAALFERTSRKVTLTPIGERLRDDLTPHHRGLLDAVDTATATARGSTGTLTVGIVGATGHELAHVTALFRSRHPGCELRFREAHFSDPFGPLRSGDVDVQLLWAPVREPDLTVGPVVSTEGRILAVAPYHPFAARETVTMEDFGDTMFVDPSTAPAYWMEAMLPTHTPAGRPVRRGPQVTTFQEVLAVVAAGQAVSPAQAHVTTYYQRPDVVYVPVVDASPTDWVLVWRTTGETELVRAYARAARDTTR